MKTQLTATSAKNMALIEQAIADYSLNLDLMAGKYEEAGLSLKEIAFAIARAQWLLKQDAKNPEFDHTESE